MGSEEQQVLRIRGEPAAEAFTENASKLEATAKGYSAKESQHLRVGSAADGSPARRRPFYGSVRRVNCARLLFPGVCALCARAQNVSIGADS